MPGYAGIRPAAAQRPAPPSPTASQQHRRGSWRTEVATQDWTSSSCCLCKTSDDGACPRSIPWYVNHRSLSQASADVCRCGVAGRLGWGSGEVARGAGVADRGRATPAGSDQQLVSAGTILAETQGEVFSKRQRAFEFARPRRARRLIPSYDCTQPTLTTVKLPIPARRQRWRRVTAAGRVHVASSSTAAPMPAESHSRCCRSRRLSDKDLDRQRVVDHIAAEVRVVAVWLQALVRTLGASQKCIPTGLRRRDPVVFPASPGVPVYGVEEVAVDPRCAAINADPDLRYNGVPRPCGAENRIGATRLERLIHARARDLGFQLHLGEGPANGCSGGIVPVAIVGCLPVALEGLRGRNDVGQPLYRRHTIVARHDGAQRIAMIERKILSVHRIGAQHVGLQCPLPRDAAGIGDCARRLRLLLRYATIGALEHEFAGLIGQPG